MNGCIYRTDDGKCEFWSDYGKNIVSYCDPSDCEGKKPSNADRIRAMTDEELATNFASRFCPIKDEFYKCGEINKKEFSWEDCESCWLNWLKATVEVET